jgi:RTX calcium-binding nonapeptide repeat (4 copies)
LIRRDILLSKVEKWSYHLKLISFGILISTIVVSGGFLHTAYAEGSLFKSSSTSVYKTSYSGVASPNFDMPSLAGASSPGDAIKSCSSIQVSSERDLNSSSIEVSNSSSPSSATTTTTNNCSVSDSSLGGNQLASANRLGITLDDEAISASVNNDDLILCDTADAISTHICIGTDDDDIIYFNASIVVVFSLDGNDLIFDGIGDNRLYGGKDDDLIAAGAGNDLVDGGPNDDVLLGAGGNDLLIGGKGNDKLFGGSGSTIMFGGKGANHFDCSLSALGLAKGVVMDYNPTKGDVISGPCKVVNTLAMSKISGMPAALPDTGESGGSSTTSASEIVPGIPIE